MDASQSAEDSDILRFVKTSTNATSPSRATVESAGVDLYRFA